MSELERLREERDRLWDIVFNMPTTDEAFLSTRKELTKVAKQIAKLVETGYEKSRS